MRRQPIRLLSLVEWPSAARPARAHQTGPGRRRQGQPSWIGSGDWDRWPVHKGTGHHSESVGHDLDGAGEAHCCLVVVQLLTVATGIAFA
jgi:hypothetical protein